MRGAIVATSGTARAFQLAALLLVGAGVFLVLAHGLVNGRTPAAVPPARAGFETLSPYAALPHVTYRADACGGDYVCDERGAWEITPIQPKQELQPHLMTTDLGKATRSQ